MKAMKGREFYYFLYADLSGVWYPGNSELSIHPMYRSIDRQIIVAGQPLQLVAVANSSVVLKIKDTHPFFNCLKLTTEFLHKHLMAPQIDLIKTSRIFLAYIWPKVKPYT